MNENKIIIKTVEATQIAYIRYVGLYQKAAKLFPRIMQSINFESDGAPFCRCFSTTYENQATIEVCVPTKAKPTNASIQVKRLSSSKVLSITHYGSYKTLPETYKTINQYIQENQLKVTLPYKEIYIKGPTGFLKTKQNQYITEIQFPLEEE